jgi:hypothetical protein
LKLNELNTQIEELIHESSGLKDIKQEKIFNPLLKILKLTVFMTLSKSRLTKVIDTINKAKLELNQLNSKIDEVNHSIKVSKIIFYYFLKESKYNGDDLYENNRSELDLNSKIKQHMSNLKLLHNQLENSLISMIKSIAKSLVSPKEILSRKL